MSVGQSNKRWEIEKIAVVASNQFELISKRARDIILGEGRTMRFSSGK